MTATATAAARSPEPEPRKPNPLIAPTSQAMTTMIAP